MSNPTARNKKVRGRVFCSDKHSIASSRDMRKIINYLEMNPVSFLTEIKNETGVNIYKIKDALLFLNSIGIIKVSNPSIHGMKYYTLTGEYYVNKKG